MSTECEMRDTPRGRSHIAQLCVYALDWCKSRTQKDPVVCNTCNLLIDTHMRTCTHERLKRVVPTSIRIVGSTTRFPTEDHWPGVSTPLASAPRPRFHLASTNECIIHGVLKIQRWLVFTRLNSVQTSPEFVTSNVRNRSPVCRVSSYRRAGE